MAGRKLKHTISSKWEEHLLFSDIIGCCVCVLHFISIPKHLKDRCYTVLSTESSLTPSLQERFFNQENSFDFVRMKIWLQGGSGYFPHSKPLLNQVLKNPTSAQNSYPFNVSWPTVCYPVLVHYKIQQSWLVSSRIRRLALSSCCTYFHKTNCWWWHAAGVTEAIPETYQTNIYLSKISEVRTGWDSDAIFHQQVDIKYNTRIHTTAHIHEIHEDFTDCNKEVSPVEMCMYLCERVYV